MSERNKAPVFVVGCHRSGTNLLYDNLMSAGGFALYRASSFVYETLLPRFGDPSLATNRRKLVEAWLRTKGFRRTGLDAADIRTKLLAGCRSAGDFLRIVMGEIARQQNARRWATYGPDNILYMPQIKRELPDALFVHIVRDGRDIALSLSKIDGLRPLPWDKDHATLAAALYWQWTVRKGKEFGRHFPSDYTELRYEDLVTHPRKALAKLGEFIDHDLDYDRIQSVGIGRVSAPNTSFAEEARQPGFNPVRRWKQKLSSAQAAEIEALVGDCLQEFGYPLTAAARPTLARRIRLMDVIYPRFYDTKLWLRSHAPLGRWVSTAALEMLSAE